MNRTDRLMGIVLELQARGELRAEDLARTFEVSVRTVYRDMEALCETGVPVVATPGKGYRLMEGYFLPPLSFTPAEAALLLLGGEFIRDRVDPELRRAADDALLKLAGVLPAEWREVEPVRLIYLADAWHVAAYSRERAASRLFRLDRIDRLEETGERFEPSERHAVGRDPDEVWDTFPEARVRFDAAVLRWARERRPYFFRREEADADGPVLVYSLRDEAALVGWLLGWGGA